MTTLGRVEDLLGLVPSRIVPLLGRVDEGRGREGLHRQQRPAALERLLEVALIQSAESSNALEGIVAPPARMRALMAGRTAPRNRSEEEIAGYRHVLGAIHESHAHMPVTANVVLQTHRDLYLLTATPGGRWKTSENRIEARHPDGTVETVFPTVPAIQTPAAMEDLHRALETALASHRHHPLLLVGAYVLDLLCIHPFLDGNGRLARLLTLLLLYRTGYGVGRWISLEKLVEKTKESYYETLRASSDGWHESAHDPWPWLGYFVGIVAGAYETLEERIEEMGGRGAKTEAIHAFVRSQPSGATFRVADVRENAAGAGGSHVSKVLARLRDAGLIEPVGRGRGARWRRLPQG